MEEIDFPVNNDIIPNHIGAIGEAIFTSTSEPPEPIPQLIRNYCRSEVPDWVPSKELNIVATPNQNRRTFVVEKEDQEIHWEHDANISASFRLLASDDIEHYQEIKETYGTVRWEYEFPVELKTGTSAELAYNNQREVMKYLSMKSETQPVFVHLRIDDLPERFTVADVKFIK